MMEDEQVNLQSEAAKSQWFHKALKAIHHIIIRDN